MTAALAPGTQTSIIGAMNLLRTLGRGGLPAIAILLLAACQTAPPRQAGPANNAVWQQRQARLNTLGEWRVVGRVGARAGDNGGSGSLIWWQQGEHFELRFSGPFGAGATRISGQDGTLTVDTGDDRGPVVFYDPETDLTRYFGWPMPVYDMRYWMLGLPAPGKTTSARVDAQGRLRELEQGGWRVEYQDYNVVGSIALPRRLVAERGDVRIKLLVERWYLGAAAGAAP